MVIKSMTSLTVLVVSAMPLVVHAADNQELTEIREQIKQLKQNYESRIQELEVRLQKAEVKVQKAETVAAQATTKAESTVKASTSSSASIPTAQTSKGVAAFNPATSLVLQGRYANLSQDPNAYKISGFLPGGEIGPGKRGFSLSETEMTMSANVDDKFFGQATIAVTPEDEIEVEEAYALTNALPVAGLSIKAGRFFSGIGYQNEQHQHAWDFVDAPLAYQAFLGGQFGNDGLQLKWIAPTDLFVELAAEIGSGENFPGTARNKNGGNAGALTAKLGGDIGNSTSWRVGLSGLKTHAENREFNQEDLFANDSLNSFTGKSKVGIADFILKYSPNGNTSVTNFKLQGEYFKRKEDGYLTYDSDGALGLTNLDAYRSSQSGWYLQGVYQFMPRWRIGLRYDRLDRGTIDLASNNTNFEFANFNPHKSTLMVDWSPSEFSRLRLQFAQDRTQPGITDNQLLLQYIMTLGAHGAHKF